MPLESGSRLGRYEIRSLLGAGGMGEVYLAHDSKLERKVALKLLPADFTADAGAPPPLRAGSARRLGPQSPEHRHRSTTSAATATRSSSPPSSSKARRCATGCSAGASPLAEALRHRRPGRRCPRAGASRRHRPPRHQARKHHAATATATSKSLDFGLAKLAETAADQDTGARHARPSRRSAGARHRDGRVHVARAGARAARGRAHGRLEPRRRALRDDRRTPAVRGRDEQRRHRDDPPAGAADSSGPSQRRRPANWSSSSRPRWRRTLTNAIRTRAIFGNVLKRVQRRLEGDDRKRARTMQSAAITRHKRALSAILRSRSSWQESSATARIAICSGDRRR